jgi:hypothetical protein
LKEGDKYIQKKCEKELKEFERAQRNLETKLADIMKSEQMETIEQGILDSNHEVSKNMQSVQRTTRIDKNT